MKTLWQEMIKAGWVIGGSDSRRLVANHLIRINDELANEFDQEVKSGDTIALGYVRTWTVE